VGRREREEGRGTSDKRRYVNRTDIEPCIGGLADIETTELKLGRVRSLQPDAASLASQRSIFSNSKAWAELQAVRL
jgi:hypothetical protein